MGIFDVFVAVVWGIVEGITEWLPISSTGHMILVDEFIKLDVSPEFMNMFLVVICNGKTTWCMPMNCPITPLRTNGRFCLLSIRVP